MLTSVVDRNGFRWAELVWNGDALVSLRVPGAVIRGERVQHPLFGDANPITGDDGAVLTHISVIDWFRPTEIPAIAEPGRLPAGSGGAILNVLAQLAATAQVPAMRYAGPYPTTALWRALTRSFEPFGSEEIFTSGLVHRMATLARSPIAIDFIPSPHQRLAIPGGHVELRHDELDRVTLDGITYERSGHPARLVKTRCELWFGDTRYAVIAKLTDDGTLRDAMPVPACESTVLGQVFPRPLVDALAELIAQLIPFPLAPGLPAWLARRTVRWADCQARSARFRDDVIEVHAALWDAVAPHGMGNLAIALAEAMAPVISAALTADVARATTPP